MEQEKPLKTGGEGGGLRRSQGLQSPEDGIRGGEGRRGGDGGPSRVDVLSLFTVSLLNGREKAN